MLEVTAMLVAVIVAAVDLASEGNLESDAVWAMYDEVPCGADEDPVAMAAAIPVMVAVAGAALAAWEDAAATVGSFEGVDAGGGNVAI